MKFIYDFIPAGSVVTTELGTLYLDVGNQLAPGIIDHHQPDAPKLCSTRLVLEYQDLILSHVKSAPEGAPLRIVTHNLPDFDAVASVYYTQELLAGQALEDYHLQLADYIDEIDQGHTRLYPAAPFSPYSLFMMLGSRLVTFGAHVDRKAANVAMLQEGILFIEALIRAMHKDCDLYNAGRQLAAGRYRLEGKRVLEDLHAYQADVGQAQTFRCLLSTVDGKLVVEVPGIWAKRPTSRLFKSWARGDVQPDRPDGFVFTAVKIDSQRTILSVDPSSGVYLKGLGAILNHKEMKKRKELGMIQNGTNRPGYDLPDPWYDGRGSFHKYTIVDSPRAGTVLDDQEICNAFAEFQASCCDNQ